MRCSGWTKTFADGRHQLGRQAAVAETGMLGQGRESKTEQVKVRDSVTKIETE